MRVTWTKVHMPPEEYMDCIDHYFATTYSGEVVSTVRSWGDTRFVVALDSGEFVEVPITEVQQEGKCE